MKNSSMRIFCPTYEYVVPRSIPMAFAEDMLALGEYT